MPVDLSDFEPLTEAKPRLDLSDFEPITPPAQTSGMSDFEPIDLAPAAKAPLLDSEVLYPSEFQTPDLTPQRKGIGERGFGEGAGAGLIRGVGGIVSSLGGLARGPSRELAKHTTMGVSELIGEGAVFEAVGGGLTKIGERIKQTAPASESVEKGGAFQLGNPRWWIERSAEFAPQLATQLGLAYLSGGSTLTFMAAGGAQMAGDTFNEAYQDRLAKGQDEATARELASGEAAVVGLVGSLIERIPGNEFLSASKPLRSALANRLRGKILVRGAAGLTAESLEETFQEVATDAAALGFRQDYDRMKNAWDRYRAAAVLGGLPGAVVGVMTPDAKQAAPAATTTAPPPPATEAEVTTETIPTAPPPQPPKETLVALMGEKAPADAVIPSPTPATDDAARETQTPVEPTIVEPAVPRPAEGVTAPEVAPAAQATIESTTTPQAALVGSASPPTTITVWKAQRRVGDVKEGPRLGEFYTSSEEAANRLADLTGDVTQHSLTLEKPLVIPAKAEGFEYYDSPELDEIFKKAGVKFKFGDEVLDEEVWRLIDEGGKKLVNALRKAGYDSIQFPEHIVGKEQTTTLVFDKPKAQEKSHETLASDTSGKGSRLDTEHDLRSIRQTGTPSIKETGKGGIYGTVGSASAKGGYEKGGLPQGVQTGGEHGRPKTPTPNRQGGATDVSSVTKPRKELTPSEEKVQGQAQVGAEPTVTPPEQPPVQTGGEALPTVEPIQTESQRIGFNRTTPTKGTPERDALEAAWNAYDAKRSPLSEQEQKLKSEMERTTRYSNKWETLNKRRDKIIEKQSKLEQDSKAMRERIRQAYLEDRAESTNPIVALKALGDLGKAKDAYERVKAMVKEEAIKQGATPEEAEQTGIEAWMYTITEDVALPEIVRRRVEGTRMAAREAEINPFVATLTKLERGEIRDAERELKYAAPDAKKFAALKKELTAKQESAAKSEADARARIAREEQESRAELANEISGMTRDEFLKYRDENWERFTTAKNYFGQRKLAQEHVESLKPETRSRVEIVGNGKTKWRVLQTYESAKAGAQRIIEAARQRADAETAPPAAVPPTEAPKPAAEVPGALVTIAKSATLNNTLPEELRQYSEQERADIAKALGTTETEPEALSDALIARYAVNKTETPSPFPKGEVGPEARTDEIDALVKSEGGPAPFSPEGLAAEPKERVGIIPGVSSLSPVSIRRMVTNVVGWLRPRGHKPSEAYERLQIRDSERAAADRDIAYASRDLLKALRKQYGLSRLEMLGGGSRRIPVADVQLMTEYLKGNPTVGASIPPEIRGILRTMRDDINGASQRVIDRLQWDLNHAPVGSAKAQRIQDLINTIQSNMDVYVHRAYKFFDAKDNAPDWYAKLPASIRQNAENYLQSTSPTPLTPAEARAKLLNWLSDLKDAGSFGTAGKVGAKDPSILMQRKVIPKELRAVLGEYNSPLAVYAKSMSKMSSWVANHKFLTDVKQMGMGRWLFEDDMAPPGFNTKIAAEGSDSMSPLNGLRTSPEIAEAFTNLNAIRERSGITGAAAKLWFSAIAQSKFAATVQSTMTQARNLLSRPLMAAMAGHWNPAPVAKGVKALYADMIGSDKTWQQYTREAYKYGVLGDTAHGGELRAIIQDAALQDVAPADLYSWSLMRAAKTVGWDAPAKLYRASDELGNLVGWENEMASQRKIHPTWTDEQIKSESAKIVREIYPTYSETPELVQFFRKVPLTGPFVTFPYQIIRTMWNSTSRGLVEMRSTNAEERKVGAKRLAGVTFALMAGTAAQELAKALLGIRSEEEDDFRLFQPPWARNAKFLFTGKDQKTGELSAINLSYIDPYSYMTDPVMSIISTARRKEPIDETIARAAKEFFRPWISEQMLPAAIVDSARNTTQMGGKVFNETDEAWQKAIAIGKHIGATLVPGTIQRVERRIIPAARDEQPEYGRKLELGREIAREVTGVAFEKFNFKTGLAGKVRGFDEARENAEDVFRKAATQTQKTSPENVLKAYQDADARRFAAFREMRQVYLAAIRRGVSAEEARRIMESRGMNAAASSMIARGVYRPMQVTDTVRRRATDVKRTLPMNEIQQIVQKERSLD